jgi:hypothetical protein
MSLREFSAWRQYFAERPWSEREALIAWAVFSASPATGRRRWGIADMMPQPPATRSTVVQLRDNLRAYKAVRKAG